MIGILAPYDFSDTTTAAIRLADVAVAAGRDVRYVSVGNHRCGVHPFWDQRVRSGKGANIYTAARGITHAIWFVTGELLGRNVDLVNKSVKRTCVPSVHLLTLAAASFLCEFDAIVAPSQSARRVLRERVLSPYAARVFSDSKPPRVTGCRWTSGLTPACRKQRLTMSPVRVLVYCEGHAINTYGSGILSLVEGLATDLRDAEVRVLSTASWSRSNRRDLARLVAASGGKITAAHAGNRLAQQLAFCAADWLVLPSVRSNFAAVVPHVLHAGTPVIAYNVPPFNEHVVADANGVLVPCDAYESQAGAPSAVPSAVAFLRVAVDSIGDVRLWNRLRGNDWGLAADDAAFVDFWRGHFREFEK